LNSDTDPTRVEAQVRDWLERAVIGLNLCPFARAPYRQQRVRLQVSAARDETALAADLERELQHLQDTPLEQCETTLLIHPDVLQEFAAFNQFLDVAEACVRRLGLEGEIQIASFHPEYRFAGSAAADVENCSNRSPFPILHLLREASIERGLEAIEDPDAIYQRNLETLRRLGPEGWAELWRTPV
jgi:hypothetical protein